MRLNSGVDVTDLINKLRQWEADLRRAAYHPHETEDLWRPFVDAFARGSSKESISDMRAMDYWYQSKIESIEDYLRYAVADNELTSNLLSDRFWNFLNMINRGELISVQGAFGLECLRQSSILSRFRERLETVAACVKDDRPPQVDQDLTEYSAIVVPDTNIFVHCGPIQEIDWQSHVNCNRVRIIVPHVVVDELDTLKWSGRDKDIRLQVRVAIRDLKQLTGGKSPGRSAFVRDSVSLAILPDAPGHIRLPSNDEEICDRALLLKQLTYDPVVLATNDMGMHIRAHTFDLEVIEIPDLDSASDRS